MRKTRKYSRNGKSRRKYRKRQLAKIKKSLKRQKQKGGFLYSRKKAFVGYPWLGSQVKTWPGVAGQPGMSNYLPFNYYWNQPGY